MKKIMLVVSVVFILTACSSSKEASEPLKEYKLTVLIHELEGPVNKVMTACRPLQPYYDVEIKQTGVMHDIEEIIILFKMVSESRVTQVSEEFKKLDHLVSVFLEKIN